MSSLIVVGIVAFVVYKIVDSREKNIYQNQTENYEAIKKNNEEYYVKNFEEDLLKKGFVINKTITFGDFVFCIDYDNKQWSMNVGTYKNIPVNFVKRIYSFKEFGELEIRTNKYRKISTADKIFYEDLLYGEGSYQTLFSSENNSRAQPLSIFISIDVNPDKEKPFSNKRQYYRYPIIKDLEIRYGNNSELKKDLAQFCEDLTYNCLQIQKFRIDFYNDI